MKVAVIGLSGMGQRHLEALRACDCVTQVAGCDIDAALAARVCDTYSAAVFNDLQDMLDKFRPDAAVVVTPPDTHEHIVRACLLRDIAVLTEKPIATTLSAATSLVELAAARAVPFQCGFQLRYSGLQRALQHLLTNGTLGALTSAVQTQMSAPIADAHYMSLRRTGGLFYEKLCHHIDFFRLHFGEPQRCMAIAAPNVLTHYGVPDNVIAVFEFAGGRQGAINFSTRRTAHCDAVSAPISGRPAGHFSEFTFVGDAGSASFDSLTGQLEVVAYNRRADLQSEQVCSIDVRASFGEPVYDLVSQDCEFLSRVDSGVSLRFPAGDALQSMVWTEIAEASVRRSGAWLTYDALAPFASHGAAQR